MKLSILDAIDKYKDIHSQFSNGSIGEEDAKKKLAALADECKANNLVFAPKVENLYEHGQFETSPVEDEESSSEEYEEEYVSSED